MTHPDYILGGTNAGYQKTRIMTLFFIFFLFFLIITSKSQSPLIDTVITKVNTGKPNKNVPPAFHAYLKKFWNDTSTWQYKMEQSDDKWSRIVRKEDFQLFFRYDRYPANKKNSTNGYISFYGDATLFWLNAVNEVEIAAAGVTPENAKEFVYHITVNDSTEIVPWSKPVNFRTNKHLTYAYLGKFDIHNRMVKLEFYNINNYKDKSVWLINGLYMPPAFVKMIVVENNNKYLPSPHKQHYLPYDQRNYFPQDGKHTKAISFNWSDSINDIRLGMKNTLQNDMYNVYLKKTIDNISDTVLISNRWVISYYSPNPELFISSSYFNKPGKYEIIVVVEAPDDFKINAIDKAVKIPFTVLPAKTKSFTSLQLLTIIIIVILIALCLFLSYYFITKRRSAKTARQKEIATLQLQSVRSQLNPHFMFNALAGIQNLMNRGDIDATNNYLLKFSRITRNVLDDKNKEAITIDEEVSLLKDYLEMEQMRFGFNYAIEVDEKIDRVNTEIPSMLLQPYIENAVKHGVSSIKQTGFITINILLKSGNLVMEVRDNGVGYDMQSRSPGNGTVLSEKRVDLFNQVNKNQKITVSKRSDKSGTTISIQLNDWV